MQTLSYNITPQPFLILICYVYLPGVVVREPFSYAGIAAICCVMATQRRTSVIGHSIQIIDCIYCEERGETTAIKHNYPGATVKTALLKQLHRIQM